MTSCYACRLVHNFTTRASTHGVPSSYLERFELISNLVLLRLYNSLHLNSLSLMQYLDGYTIKRNRITFPLWPQSGTSRCLLLLFAALVIGQQALLKVNKNSRLLEVLPISSNSLKIVNFVNPM